MKGPIKMYQTRQIVRHDAPITLPSCMYKMKSVYGPRDDVVESADHVSAAAGKKLDIFDQVKQFLKNNHQIPGMAELEARQEKILQQLAELKKQMLNIKSELNITTTPAAVCTLAPTAPQLKDVPDIVVNVNPNNPPYSLAILQRLWQNTVHLAVSTHLHSTVASLPQKASELSQTLHNFKPKTNVPKINLRLIWKDVSDLEFLLTHLLVLGEVNVLRYLSRVTNSTLSYDSDPDCFDIDSHLDVCHLLVNAKTKTERTNLLQTFNKSLSKSQWLSGRSKVSIADLAACSVIKQVVPPNEVNVNLTKWLQRCENVV